jgi:hypothetical protein
MSDPFAFEAVLPDEDATARFMADLGLLVGKGDVIALSGDLGGGKTAAARALIRFMAGDGEFEVPSPTFTLVQNYDLPAGPIMHADFYRLGAPADIEELGLLPWPEDALVVIEWPERAGHLLPEDRIDLALRHVPALGTTGRAVTVTGHGKSAAIAARLAALRDFVEAAHLSDAERKRVAGDASSRSYARLLRGDQSVILMNSPPRPDGPAIHDGRSYSAAVHLAENVKAFIAMAHGLRERGYSAPGIHHADIERGFLIIEDLGGEGFVRGEPPEPDLARYETAVDMLAALHQESLPDMLPVAPHVVHVIPPYDIDAFLIEASLLLDWYLPDRGVTATAAMRAEFAALWRGALGLAIEGPHTWVLRDFHSPNLIWLASRPDTARVGLIDFQDAVMGPPAYDVASLLQDARVDISEEQEIGLFARYVRARRAARGDFDAAAFATSYAALAGQRATKVLGIFARLNRRDGKPHYLRHQPRVWGYLQRALGHPAMAGLRDWYAANVPAPDRPPAS